jgi:hypothetical protein
MKHHTEVSTHGRFKPWLARPRLFISPLPAAVAHAHARVGELWGDGGRCARASLHGLSSDMTVALGPRGLDVM